MPGWLQTISFGLVQIFMLVGLFGLLVPIFPGLTVMWLSALGYGLIKGFNPTGIVLFIIITILMLLGNVVDNLLMGHGAHKSGATWASTIVALLAGVIFTVLLPPIGGIIAAPLAVLLLEYIRQKDWNKAFQALRGMASGWGLSFLARFGIGLVIMILWWIWAWAGR